MGHGMGVLCRRDRHPVCLLLHLVAAKRGLLVVLLVIGLMYMGAFEWIREAGRRPFLIYGHTYSTSALAKDLE